MTDTPKTIPTFPEIGLHVFDDAEKAKITETVFALIEKYEAALIAKPRHPVARIALSGDFPVMVGLIADTKGILRLSIDSREISAKGWLTPNKIRAEAIAVLLVQMNDAIRLAYEEPVGCSCGMCDL